MNTLRTHLGVSRRWIGAAVVILLFACSAIVYAQEGREKKKKDESAPPAGKAARPAAQPQGAANPGSGQAKQQNPDRPRPDSGQGAQQNPGRPNRPDAGQAAPQNPGRLNRPNSGQGAPQIPVRPNRPDAGQAAPQNPGRLNRPDSGQGAPQNLGRPDRPNMGQGAPQNLGRPDRPNTIQPGRDQSRPGLQNSGQNMRQNPGQRQPDSRNGGPGPQAIRTSNGGMVRRDAGGQVRQVHTPGGAVITHRSNGTQRIEMVRPGNRTIVTNSHGRGGYIQRPLMVSNRQYVQRTYSVRGVAYARVYRPVTYRGVSMHVYT
ncbi:MAG TPA: hypothetical protein VF311_05535, partial [Terriglobales bacterium]